MHRHFRGFSWQSNFCLSGACKDVPAAQWHPVWGWSLEHVESGIECQKCWRNITSLNSNFEFSVGGISTIKCHVTPWKEFIFCLKRQKMHLISPVAVRPLGEFWLNECIIGWWHSGQQVTCLSELEKNSMCVVFVMRIKRSLSCEEFSQNFAENLKKLTKSNPVVGLAMMLQI